MQTDVSTAELTLPPEGHLPDDNSTSIYDLYKNAVQRLRIPGAIYSGSTIPPYGVEYVGIIYPLSQRGVHFLADRSVSAIGDCKLIAGAVEYASVDQILTIESNEVRSLRPEFSDGRLKIILFAGDTHILVDPKVINGFHSFPMRLWPDLPLAQLYEGQPNNFIQVGTKIFNVR